MIESERGVVYSERRSSVENNNAGLLYEQLIAATYAAHPYGWPVIGWSSDIEAWTWTTCRPTSAWAMLRTTASWS